MKDESSLKSDLRQEIVRALPSYLVLRHEDVRVSGIPDISLTGFNYTSWWEVKHGTPDFKSKGVQEDVCRKLAAAGFCRYLVYWESGEESRTLIVHPKHFWRAEKSMAWFRELPLLADEWRFGINHKFVIDYMRKIHER